MTGRTASRFVALFAGPFVFGVSAARAGTCALCREVLQSGGSPGLIHGYYLSIVLIVSVSLLALASGVRYAWRRYN